MRSIGAVIIGVLVAAICYWVGAVIALLSMHGIPLGSPGGPPTSGDILVHIALAAMATLAGARTAVRLAPRVPEWHAGAVALVLAVTAIQGFGKPASNWPGWFGFAMAAACLGGALAAARSRTRRP